MSDNRTTREELEAFVVEGSRRRLMEGSVIGRSRNEIPFVVPLGVKVVYYHITVPADETLNVVLDKEGTATHAFYGTLEVKNG